MNDTLTDREVDKVFTLYADYGAERLHDFIRMIWKEAYTLGQKDGYVNGFNQARVEGVRPPYPAGHSKSQG